LTADFNRTDFKMNTKDVPLIQNNKELVTLCWIITYLFPYEGGLSYWKDFVDIGDSTIVHPTFILKYVIQPVLTLRKIMWNDLERRFFKILKATGFIKTKLNLYMTGILTIHYLSFIVEYSEVDQKNIPWTNQNKWLKEQFDDSNSVDVSSKASTETAKMMIEWMIF
jgi:hypothetical protein